jgi:HEAT repeat protein
VNVRVVRKRCGQFALVTCGDTDLAIQEFYFFCGDAVPALVLALQDEDVQVRRNAAVILAYFVSPPAGQPGVDILEALPTLREKLQDADGEVRQIARRAIENIERLQ